MAVAKRLNEHAERILSIIQKSPEPITFTEIWRKSGLSKSTVSKYLKILEVDQMVNQVRDKHAKRSKYKTTIAGLHTDTSQQKDFRKVVEFYNRLSVPDSIIWQLTQLLLPRMDSFNSIPQSNELNLSLFYVYCNLISNRRFISRNAFCDMYHIKRLALDYHIDKIMEYNLGFHYIACSGLDYYFHDADELGVNLHQLTEAHIVQFLLKQRYQGAQDVQSTQRRNDHSARRKPPEMLPLDTISWSIVEELHKRNIVDENMRDAFLLFVRKYAINIAIEKNIPQELFPEVQDEGFRVTPVQVDQLRGFCNNCGNWILQGEHACTRCKSVMDDAHLLSDCIQAQERTRQYKENILSDTVRCLRCGHMYPRSWNLPACPSCSLGR